MAPSGSLDNSTSIIDETKDPAKTGLWIETSTALWTVVVYICVMSCIMILFCAVHVWIRNHYKIKCEDMVEALESTYKIHRDNEVQPSPFAVKPDEKKPPKEVYRVQFEPGTLAAVLHQAAPAAYPPIAPPVHGVLLDGAAKNPPKTRSGSKKRNHPPPEKQV